MGAYTQAAPAAHAAPNFQPSSGGVPCSELFVERRTNSSRPVSHAHSGTQQPSFRTHKGAVRLR